MPINPPHTPGPWTVGVDGISGCYFIPEVEAGDSPHGLPVVTEADADLIAAAPDLLEALKAVRDDADTFDIPNHVLARINFAIDKAEGQ